MFDEKGRYVINDYQMKPPFSSFLPGIAGPMGVPVWCYYNNRGQGVCSFGAKDKDHAIMEFSPARTAYREVSRTGFRTFCKADGAYGELFTRNCAMHIGMSELEVTCREGELEGSAVYFGVPGERTAALARVLTVHNAGTQPVELELLDGMPELVPYGVDQDALKNMTNLAQAWMRSEDADVGRACFRVRASMADTAQVTAVEGCNFCLGWDETGAVLRPLVQPELVFGADTALARAEGFACTPLETLCGMAQVTENRFPCCFLPRKTRLGPGGTVRIFSLYGQAEDKARVTALAERVHGGGWFEAKRREAQRLVDELCGAIDTHTADPMFDAYCKQSYLDNLLRGGAPVFFAHGEKKTPFYLYSRKHGDPEREYNYFSLGGEYYAQGNGNYRDVNQNRRCDVLFAPEVEDVNIRTFFDLIQTDGYNPLVIQASTYTLPTDKLDEVLETLPAGRRGEGRALLSKPFTPGKLAMALEDWGLDATALTAAIVCEADWEPNAEFTEGCWCDHWTYNLDLIESFLSVYPERKEELLFEDCQYRWYESRTLVNPRAKRYRMTPNGLRQYHALDETVKAGVTRKWVHTAQGEEAYSTLIEKLLLLCAIKTATLDAAGMGVEMEGGKPGWYDALNGLPGLLGSSMAESCELARLLRFTIQALEQRDGTVTLYTEIAGLLLDVDEILNSELGTFTRWDRLNLVKEDYRVRTAAGFAGEQMKSDRARLAAMLRTMEQVVLDGIRKAVELGGGICPTYFTFEADGVAETAEGPMPTALIPHPLPLFLEGPTRWLKLDASKEEKRVLVEKVRQSGLYDRELGMYKVNESLSGVSFEAGRALAFSPGWLENESIWLHMEYKYLLELLKSGLYEQFCQSFHAAAVPFLDPARYGRSPLENVSFLASSANPDPTVWGRGFVARLSGSTAEFLQIWQLMFFGAKPFRMGEAGLELHFSPCIPGYLIGTNGMVQAAFLGHIPVTYRTNELSALCPGKTLPDHWLITGIDGRTAIVDGPYLPSPEARRVREGKITEIQVIMK